MPWSWGIAAAWPSVKIEKLEWNDQARVSVGEDMRVEAVVALGPLAAADVTVELYFGKLHGEHALAGGTSRAMHPVAELPDGHFRFAGTLSTPEAGEHAFAVRVLPKHPGLAGPHAMGLIAWH